jgi:membrane protease YdiL (CAAX protease family)
MPAPEQTDLSSPAPAVDAAEAELAAPTLGTPPRRNLRWVFLGGDGLRAGWSLLLFLIVAAALTVAFGAIIGHFYPAARNPPKTDVLQARSTILRESSGFGVLALAAWIMSLIERRSFGLYGLGGSRKLRDLLEGLAVGIVAISAVIGGLYATHLIAFDGFALHGNEAWRYGAAWALGFLFVGFLEEFMTRGYIQYTAARGIGAIVRMLDPGSTRAHALGFWITAGLFSAALFMALHLANHGETPIGIAAVGAAGLTFAYSLWRTGYLWWAVGFHAAWDWGQTYLYGVADSGLTAQGHLLNTHPIGSPVLSGGTTGPEGSIFVLPALAIVCYIIHVTLPRRDYPLTPSQRPPAPPETM